MELLKANLHFRLAGLQLCVPARHQASAKYARRAKSVHSVEPLLPMSRPIATINEDSALKPILSTGRPNLQESESREREIERERERERESERERERERERESESDPPRNGDCNMPYR